mgnify:FL=1
MQNDALYLLCSDGLCHELSHKEIEDRFQAIYLKSKDAMIAALRETTELCKHRGETDNITALLLKTQESVYVRPQKSGINRIKQMLHIAVPDDAAPVAMLLETAQVIHTQEVVDRE